MLMDDGVSGLWEVKDMTWNDIFRSSEFKSLYQLHYVFLHTYLQIFGTNSVAYFIWFVLLQSAVLTAFYNSMPKLCELFGVTKTNVLFFIVAVLLMTSPHNMENVVWAATSHYNLAFLFYFILLGLFVHSFVGKRQFVILFHFIFILSLFTMEMSLMFPVSCGLILFLYWLQSKDTGGVKKVLLYYMLPMFVSILLSFVLLQYLNDSWLPRGGSDASFIPSISDAVTHFWAYCIQAIGYTHFLSYDLRTAFYASVKSYVFWPGLITIAAIVFYSFKNKKYLLLVFFLTAGLFLLPNLFRWGSMLNRYENVRFMYFALPFIITFFLYLFSNSKILLSSLAIILLIANLIFMRTTVNDKVVAGEIHESYLGALQEYRTDDVYLLNVPSFGKGNFIFRGYNRVRISSAMKNVDSVEIKYKEVLWYYAQTNMDSFTVTRVDSQTIFVKSQTPGIWPMIEDQGAQSYENEDFEVVMDEWGGYNVRFKNPLNPNTKVLLFSVNGMTDCADLLRKEQMVYFR